MHELMRFREALEHHKSFVDFIELVKALRLAKPECVRFDQDPIRITGTATFSQHLILQLSQMAPGYERAAVAYRLADMLRDEFARLLYNLNGR